MYYQALKKSGYNTEMKYNKGEAEAEPKRKRNRARKIIWFNPPYSKNVKTKVGLFINLIERHFPTGHKLYKIFKENNIKVSYSCMKNMNAIIKAHNDNALKKSRTPDQLPKKTCNCRKKDDCPLQRDCLTSAFVYKATITQGGAIKNLHRQHGGNLQREIQKPHKIIQEPEIRKRNRAIKVRMGPQKEEHRPQHQIGHHEKIEHSSTKKRDLQPLS